MISKVIRTGLVLALLWAPAIAHAKLTSAPPQTVRDGYGTRWHRVGADDFTHAAPLGSWATDTSTAVYRGDHGMRWWTYRDGEGCPHAIHCYAPGQVLSVHGGMLDFYLHPCQYADGFLGDCSAAPRPIIPAHDGYPASQDQLYGRYEARMRVVFDRGTLADYHMAWLLWPADPADQACGESDFPEMNLRHYAVTNAYAHYGCAAPHTQGHFSRRLNLTKWHTYTQEWGPGYRRFYVGKRLLGQSRTEVYAKAERWALQIAVWNQYGSVGHVLVDWVWIGSL